MRFTKIVATVGPAVSSPADFKKYATSGVNVARLNFSHGSHESHLAEIKQIQAFNASGNSRIAIMLDTKGPEIRTGDVNTPVVITRGDTVLFTAHPTGKEKGPVITVNYDKFAKDAADARSIVIDNGTIECTVLSIKGKTVVARALESGSVSSRRHINLPGANISLPSFTDKDWSDIEFGIKHDVDFIAVSFVRTASDIRELRAFLKKNRGHADIIAKIETEKAVENIDEIIEESDGIMVARGDLGAEIPFELVPGIQDDIVSKCRMKGKPVIVATHMLESMIHLPTPTRAEVTDIAHAAMSQTDATMLSGETAGGLFPFKAIEAMSKVLDKCEKVDELDFMVEMQQHDLSLGKRGDDKLQQALSASVLARNISADALVVFSRTGTTAKAVSRCRPPVPIIVITDTAQVQRKLQLLWGVDPYHIPFHADPNVTVKSAMKFLRQKLILKKKQKIVLVSDSLFEKEKVMTVQVRLIDEA